MKCGKPVGWKEIQFKITADLDRGCMTATLREKIVNISYSAHMNHNIHSQP